MAYKTIEDTHIFAIILKNPIFQWPICKSKDGNLYQNYRPYMYLTSIGMFFVLG